MIPTTADQPGSQPLDIPDVRTNPATSPTRRETPAPRKPVREPVKVPEKVTLPASRREVSFVPHAVSAARRRAIIAP